VKPDLVQYFILFREARSPHERPFFRPQPRLWGGADPLTSNNAALNAVRTQYGSEGRLLFMSRFDVCSAVLDQADR